MSSIYKRKKKKLLLFLNLGNNNQYLILTTGQLTVCERTNLDKEKTPDYEVTLSSTKLYQLIVLVSHPTALPFWSSSLGYCTIIPLCQT